MQIGGHDGQRDLQRRKIRRHLVRQKLRTEFLGVDLRRLAERAGEKVCQRAGARLHQAAPDFAGPVRQRDDVAADVLAAHSRGISRADQRADRGAGDGDRPDAHLVERLDHRDMGKPARAAAAEREREGFHAAGASRARPGGRIPTLWRRAAAPAWPSPQRARWLPCRRARGRQCLAGSRRCERNYRRNRPTDKAADRARCASHKRRHNPPAKECRARARSNPTSEPVPASDGGMCHCIRW